MVGVPSLLSWAAGTAATESRCTDEEPDWRDCNVLLISRAKRACSANLPTGINAPSQATSKTFKQLQIRPKCEGITAEIIQATARKLLTQILSFYIKVGGDDKGVASGPEVKPAGPAVKYSDRRTNLETHSESRHGLAVGERVPASSLQLQPAVTATKRYHKCSCKPRLPATPHGQNPLQKLLYLETWHS